MKRIGDEDTRVPIELPTLHEHLRKLALRFLRERLHHIHVRLAAQVAQLDIAIARLRPRRLHAHRQQHVILRYIAKPYIETVDKPFLVENQLV